MIGERALMDLFETQLVVDDHEDDDDLDRWWEEYRDMVSDDPDNTDCEQGDYEYGLPHPGYA